MNQDFRDRLAEFNARGVEYLVVGAQAWRPTATFERLRTWMSGFDRMLPMLLVCLQPLPSLARRSTT
jgi:hypothetical protein